MGGGENVVPPQPDVTGEGASGDAGGAGRTTPPMPKPEDMPKPTDPAPKPAVEDVLDPEEKPAEKPADEKPAEEKSAEEKPAEEKPVEEKPAEETPADPAPAEEKPAEETPADPAPTEEKPADAATEEKPAEESPAAKKAATEEAAAEEEMKKDEAADPAPGLEPVDEASVEEPKAEEASPVDPTTEATEEPKADEPAAEEPAAEEPKTDEPKKPSKGTDDLFGPPKVSKSTVPVAVTPARVQEDGTIQVNGADRDWLDNTGRHGCRGKLILVLEGKVRILKDNGKTSTVAMRRLSTADAEYVQSQVRSARTVVVAASTAP
jgi:hypothetical protein